jgi:OOP family OmpA-OmpF porin
VDEIGCFREVTLRGVLFEISSAELGPSDRSLLDAAVTNFKRLPADVAANTRVVVEGHTDNTGSEAYNLALSQRRADSVKQYLIDAGISPAIITTVGKGFSDPIDTNATREGRTANRRVVVRATR